VGVKVSEELSASVFRVKISVVKMQVIYAAAKKSVTWTKPNHIAIFAFALKVEAASSSETFVSTYKTTWCHNPEDHIPNNKCHKILKTPFN
jgi:hypothetical protein